MTSFETINLDDYKKLVDNERKIFNLTENFTTPEILNKYRHTDKNIDDKIKQEEMKKEKYEHLDKIINKSIDKLKSKNDLKLMMINMIIMIIIQKYTNRIIDLIMMMKY